MTPLLCSDGFYGFDVAMVTALFIQANGHIEPRCNHSPPRPRPKDSGTERQGRVFYSIIRDDIPNHYRDVAAGVNCITWPTFKLSS